MLPGKKKIYLFVPMNNESIFIKEIKIERELEAEEDDERYVGSWSNASIL